jgi:small redox-active disulfide protein 2
MMNDTNKGVKIMGVGSARDRELLESVQMAVRELGMTIDIQMVSDINTFLKMGITAIPAMVINGRVVANGRIPGIMEIKSLLRENYSSEGTAN